MLRTSRTKPTHVSKQRTDGKRKVIALQRKNINTKSKSKFRHHNKHFQQKSSIYKQHYTPFSTNTLNNNIQNVEGNNNDNSNVQGQQQESPSPILTTLSSSQKLLQVIQSDPFLSTVHNTLSKHAPSFAVSSKNVHVMDTPTEFYQTLLSKIKLLNIVSAFLRYTLGLTRWS
eukprot:UN02797